MGTCRIDYNGSIISETEELGDILIKYNGYTIKTFSESDEGDFEAVLPCEGKYMTGDLTIGSKTLSCNKKIMATDVSVKVNMPSKVIYIFDSSRSDNFLFGKYEYTMSTGSLIALDQTSWPYSSDGTNASSTKIILLGAKTGFLTPDLGYEGHCNAELKISGNNGTQFINNVYYDGHNAGTVAIPNNVAVKLCIKAYVETSAGSPTFAYCNASGTIIASKTITATSLTTYSLDLSSFGDGYIYLSAGKGCGSLIVTDIWVE